MKNPLTIFVPLPFPFWYADFPSQTIFVNFKKRIHNLVRDYDHPGYKFSLMSDKLQKDSPSQGDVVLQEFRDAIVDKEELKV